MCMLAFFLMVLPSFAESKTMDEKRLVSFQTYVLKKEAHQERIEQAAGQEKLRRAGREARFEQVRENFKRSTVTKPPGEDAFKRKVEQQEQRYDQRRERFSIQQHQASEALHDKMDRIKMVEYELK